MIDPMLDRPDMTEQPMEARKALRGLRVWAAMTRLGRCPLAAMTGHLGSRRAAAHLHLMVDEIRTAWPEPFMVSRPCCHHMTLDESVFVDMLRLSEQKDRAGFDRLLHEMIAAEQRDRLFLSASVLIRVLGQGTFG